MVARGQAALETGDLRLLDRCVQSLLDEDPWEWRAVWLVGLGALILMGVGLAMRARPKRGAPQR